MSGLRKSYVADVHVLAPIWGGSKHNDLSKRKEEPFKFSISDSPKEISLSNDVWVSGKWGKASIGPRPLGGKYAGQVSPILGDNTVIDHHWHSIGRIDGNGYFNTRFF